MACSPPCDAPVVELTAKTLVTMRQADAVNARDGSTVRTASGYLQQRPEVAIQHKARLLLKQLLGELGMSPASRSNVDVPLPAVEGSAFQKFLERGRRLDERRQQHRGGGSSGTSREPLLNAPPSEERDT